jgi:hypothetical protein
VSRIDSEVLLSEGGTPVGVPKEEKGVLDDYGISGQAGILG